MTLPLAGESIAERYCAWANTLSNEALPGALKTAVSQELLDIVGLCLAARSTDYIASILASRQGTGRCTAIGHDAGFSETDAALINGTAAHGEDYDDTFEGSPAHPGAVVVPAVLAACETGERSGEDLLKGIAVGGELICRMSIAAPGAVHRAGFHPTAVIGALGAAAGVSAALGLKPAVGASALGVAASLASGIIEYLSEGTWTKRLHAGWASRAGLEAVRLAAAGFLGPRTVMEGPHGFFHAFTNGDIQPDLDVLTRDLGTDWNMERVAFKPYACGTMTQPFIDCAIAMRAAGVAPERVRLIECKVGEGTVHRLWEPLAEKRLPTTPYCIAAGLCEGAAGLEQFTEARVRDSHLLDIAAKVSYKIDPDNEYPRNYSGHLRVTLEDGQVLEFDQPHLRGGAKQRLTQDELERKFTANANYGGLDGGAAANARVLVGTLLECDNVAVGAALRAPR